mmetsp:Transcript_14772/g.23101  ORF Transcript_14772/g.23101 Transcript_14772/m.23101 type:complete len:703 (+) Transcript_14772:196-2304(+)|eukprot:CAMPEP_0195305052 /NCGR_PEP_ID=MMETSP0707-20130614/35594_1 /TAXON_ID=33640 /ORGANISM="Asterionellopsis glacialis, Strain CCMP134" /LENGTH=702 /DNA_ID=CAMNT_0040369061 /DNA_START=179 /DNA_END=2287 /DNA_ORIENTATION=+
MRRTEIFLGSGGRYYWKSVVVAFSCIVSISPVLVNGFAINVKLTGGRTPSIPDMPSLDDDGTLDRWVPRLPTSSSEARLIIVQITDVYTLEHFASLKTMLTETRQNLNAYGFTATSLMGGNGASDGVISVLTGDFLAPYLLSSVDRGNGMMNAIAKTPIDYLTWGNHEADIDHRTVCRHVRNYPGTWLNSNMQDHEAMDAQKPFDIVEVCSPDGTNKRRIGLVAVLSEDSALYDQFKAPGAFGGATIRDPWETLKEYKELLEGPEYNCDVVLPLQHTYVPDDHRTCREFDFPVVMSGHDHHRVDEVIEGTRLLKPGLDAVYATVLEMSWDNDSKEEKQPHIRAKFVKCDEWAADEDLEAENERAYEALAPLRNTELARVPPPFEPLSSVNSRGCVCTMGKLICSLLKSALNTSRRQRKLMVDAVILMGGNIRGGTDYPEGSFFSLEALEAEIKSDETIAVVPMPGWLIADGIAATHAGDPIPGWFQYDAGIIQEENPQEGMPPVVTHIAGEPIDHDRIYRVATKIGDLTNGQSEPLTTYFTNHPEKFPPKGAYVNVYAELMGFFARNLWRKIWEEITPIPADVSDNNDDVAGDLDFAVKLEVLCSVEDCQPEKRMAVLNKNGDGELTVDEIHDALRSVVGLSVDENEQSLAEFVFSFADTDNDGKVTLNDFETFCSEMPALYENQKWRLSYPKQKRGVSKAM